MKREDYENLVRERLVGMMMEQRLSPDTMMDAMAAVSEMFQQYQHDLTNALIVLVKKWEESFPDGSEKFYELGLRHAIDVVKEIPEGEIHTMEQDYRNFDRKVTSEDYKNLS